MNTNKNDNKNFSNQDYFLKESNLNLSFPKKEEISEFKNKILNKNQNTELNKRIHVITTRMTSNNLSGYLLLADDIQEKEKKDKIVIAFVIMVLVAIFIPLLPLVIEVIKDLDFWYNFILIN